MPWNAAWTSRMGETRIVTVDFWKRLRDLTFEDVKALQDDGVSETITLEYKSTKVSAEDLGKTFCALANTAGGRVIVGAESDEHDRAIR